MIAMGQHCSLRHGGLGVLKGTLEVPCLVLSDCLSYGFQIRQECFEFMLEAIHF